MKFTNTWKHFGLMLLLDILAWARLVPEYKCVKATAWDEFE